jgi:uncharacterized protein YqjF (DUF2071 family)
LLSYEIGPEALRPYLPSGVELDSWGGKYLVSVVGLRFLDARVLGVPPTFYRSYPQVNLRFYVRRWSNGQWRRGVVFIKQIVPKSLVAFVARLVYHEKFVALPMKYSVKAPSRDGQSRQVSYQWRSQGAWNGITLGIRDEPHLPAPGSLEEFVSEHYYGYNTHPNGFTLEYRIERPTWRLVKSEDSELVCNVGELYGPEFVDSLAGVPVSAFWAEGSRVAVHKGVKI